MLWIVFDLDTPISLLLVICLLVLLFAVSVVGCLLGYSSCLVVWIPLFLDPSDGAFGRFDLAALCGCRTLNFCFFVLFRPLSNRLKECPEFKFLPTIPIPITRWPSPSSVADLPHPTDYSTNQTLQTPHKYYQPTPLRNRLESCLGAARPEGCAVVFLNKSYQGGSLTPLRNCLES